MRRPAARLTALCLAWLGLLLVASAPAAAGTARVKDVRLWSGPEGTRLVIELTGPVEYDVFPLENPDRVVVDLANTTLGSQALPAGQGPVKQLRSGPQPGRALRIVLDLASREAPRSFVVGPDGSAGHRIVVELPGKGAPFVAASPAPVAPPPATSTTPASKDVLAMATEASPAVATAPVVTPKSRTHRRRPP